MMRLRLFALVHVVVADTSPRAALMSLYRETGGDSTWIRTDRWGEGDPCGRPAAPWFGVQCDKVGAHVTGLFPNPRGSGNPLGTSTH